MGRSKDPQRAKDRRADAVERQSVRDTRSPEEQIAKLDFEGWTATKERARLQKLVSKQEHKKKKKETLKS